MSGEQTAEIVRHRFAGLGKAACGAALPMTTTMTETDVNCPACAADQQAELERLRAERDAAVQEMTDLRDYHREFCERERREVAALRRRVEAALICPSDGQPLASEIAQRVRGALDQTDPKEPGRG